MTTPRIVIHIKSGCLARVYADVPIRVIKADEDVLEVCPLHGDPDDDDSMDNADPSELFEDDDLSIDPKTVDNVFAAKTQAEVFEALPASNANNYRPRED